MAERQKIRNFSIIAHIDHGKSTLADRMLEVTNTIEKRKMMAQVLDSMELERERGITIKMQPVRMEFPYKGETYILNLIDTPGHIDFSYEVSRALKAVEGSILLVDATQGVQAQTLTTLEMAKASGLTIIPAVSKIDSPLARTHEVKIEMSELLGCSPDDVFEVSGKTGEGVSSLLNAIIEKVGPPHMSKENASLEKSTGGENVPRALIFDFAYSTHRGIIVYVRLFEGEIKKNEPLLFSAAGEKFTALEVGIFHPDQKPQEKLSAGEIGYIVTGIKQPGIASVGDTITSSKHPLLPLAGYMNPSPVVWASVYPESQDDFHLLRQALLRLKLTDASLSFEEETSGTLGRGYRCGFLGMLHLEIITERLKREFDLPLIIATPSITYEVEFANGEKKTIYSPALFPEFGSYKMVREPWVSAKIITPPEYVGNIMTLLYEHEAETGNSEIFGENRTSIEAEMPLRELMRGFFDKLKSASSGYASLSYKITAMRDADVARLDILVADELVVAFTRVVSRKRVQEEAEAAVEKLHNVLPRQLFVLKIQGQALGRILSSKTVSALRKDVTGYLYGGDITRKMKLLEKQKKGKKKMKAHGRVNIPHDVFLKMMKQ